MKKRSIMKTMEKINIRMVKDAKVAVKVVTLLCPLIFLDK
jgi:hypothetical protein